MRKLMLLGLVAVISLPLLADTQRGKPAPTAAQIAAQKVKFLKILLDLTTAQQDQALTIYTASETAKPAVEAGLAAAEDALVQAIVANNQAGMTTAAANLGAARGQLALLEARSDAAFHQLLTTDQKTRFAEFLKGDFEIPTGPGKGVGRGHGKP